MKDSMRDLFSMELSLSRCIFIFIPSNQCCCPTSADKGQLAHRLVICARCRHHITQQQVQTCLQKNKKVHNSSCQDFNSLYSQFQRLKVRLNTLLMNFLYPASSPTWVSSLLLLSPLLCFIVFSCFHCCVIDKLYFY